MKLFSNEIMEYGACGVRGPAYVLLTLFLSKLTLDGHNKLLGFHFIDKHQSDQQRALNHCA